MNLKLKPVDARNQFSYLLYDENSLNDLKQMNTKQKNHPLILVNKTLTKCNIL